MPRQVSALIDRLTPHWRGFSPIQRVALGILAVATLALASYLLLQGPEFATVFTRLDDRDAAAIVAKLKEAKVSYRLADGGSTVLVPAGQVHEVRLRLAGEGLPQTGTVGFELFNQPNLGATEFSQKLNYQRALEGELARTIGRLAGVQLARVHLALPQPSLFSDQQKPTTASVVLQLRPGVELGTEQIRGVTHLVATSVEGLRPEHITLLDTRGRVLAGGAGSDGIAGALTATAGQLELQRGYERQVARGVQDLLDRTLGPGKAIASASVLLDWERFEANNEIFSPRDAAGQVRSSREVTESSTTEGTTAQGGVPGVESNVANSYQQVGAPGSSKSERRETTQNFELSKSVERITRVPGSIKRLTVSVVLDTAVPADQLAEFEKAIPAAVGLDPKRGDVFRLARVSFDRSSTEAEQAAVEESRRQEQMSQLLQLARNVVLPLLGLIVLAVLFVMVLRRQAPVVDRPAPRAALPGAAMPAMAMPPVMLDERLLEEVRRRRALREQVEDLAREDPQTISRVIRTWLVEDGQEQ